MKKIMIPFLFLVMMLFPTAALAVEFEISDVKIDVELQKNGDAMVIEKHTYDFDSKFKGITRELIAKKGSSIVDFKAYENNEVLEVEKKKDEYKIFRSGKKELIEVEMRYRIVNAVQRYEDGAEFYWPFFDRRNETDYESLTINIFPPFKANDVQSVGYDTAYKTDSIGVEGTVTFAMGRVPSGNNGDVRVVYEPELFPDVSQLQGTIRDKVIAEEERMEEKEAAFMLGKENAKNYGPPIMIGFGVFLFGLFGYGLTLSRRRKNAVKDLYKEFFVPKEKMSMPATIHYTTGKGLSPEAMSAALLDLVRKGYVRQLSEDEFECISRDADYPHEKELLKLLFGYIAKEKTFKIEDLETYTKNEKNHASYDAKLVDWHKGITEEIKTKDLYERKVGLRWFVALMSTAVVGIIIQFGRYELFLYLSITVLLMIIGLSFAFFYKPRTKEGHQIYQEWRQFKESFGELDIEQWKRLPSDDKSRSFTYVIGSGDESFGEQFNIFTDVEKRTHQESNSFFYFNPILMNGSFVSANTNTAVSSSSSSYSGGGTGGGGGGSGAF